METTHIIITPAVGPRRKAERKKKKKEKCKLTQGRGGKGKGGEKEELNMYLTGYLMIQTVALVLIGTVHKCIFIYIHRKKRKGETVFVRREVIP